MSSSSDASSVENLNAFSQLETYYPNPCEKINTEEFLKAASGTVSLVEKFGKIFAPVIYDMNGNIEKLTDKYNKNKDGHKYLEDMLLLEHQSNQNIAIESLLWLRRALHYISIFFECIIEDTLSNKISYDLTPFLKKAYAETLEPFHGWLGTQLFNVLTRFAPSRRTLVFVLSLEKNNSDTQVIRDMKIYNDKMFAIVQKLQHFYVEHNLEATT